MLKQILIITLLVSSVPVTVAARDKKSFRAATPSITVAAAKTGGAEQVEVESIKEKYWARGDSSEIGVVQNRIYTKSRRFQIGAFGSFLISDPFLNSNSIGGSLGYHINETYSVNFLAWRTFVRNSSALDAFEEFSGATANTNPPFSFFALEGTGSLMYGKLSFLGTSIIHYDMHLSVGAGVNYTESGAYFAPTVGIGQRFYMSKSASIRFDYRLIYYRERIIEKVVPTKIGQVRGERNNFTSSISLGVDFMVDLFGG